jgi:serine/threonine-protein kinase
MIRGAPGSEIERLFGLAIARDPSDRGAVLDQACADPELRREVESLLRADDQAAGFLDPALAASDELEQHGARIGPYRLLRKLGDGETSTVYLAARDDDQYDQRVAIKLIRPGMDSRPILQRFHQERQILASLSHPHIARLFDGGSTSSGQPYFVMEYVDGEPLDLHCQRAELSLARRLALFGQVCQAVHFAHRNLVVHRDLKPSNILVDRDGAPKLLDFGIAKLLDPERAGIRVEPTASSARLMTPHYASPEQVCGKPISTASDVYSLGVILYKLLAGRRPYELASQALHEIERVVCEFTPPPPSHVLRAARKGRLPRDLDNIVLMAMRKEPERRYASAQELADDVRRCVDRRPVLARRDTLGYRVSSFVRRNTGAVAAAALVFLSVLGGAVATTSQWRRAVAERTRAQTQRMTAEHALDFVVELFKVPDSSVAVNQVTARELLEHGAARLRSEAPQPVEIRAALQHTLAVVYRNLGDYQQAAALLDEVVATRSSIPDGELGLADSLYQLGWIDSETGHYRLADSLLRRALVIRVKLLGPDDLAVADVLERLAYNVVHSVPLHEAIDDMRRVLEIRRAKLAASDPRIVSSVAGLAALYSLAGYHDNADALFRDGMALRDRAPVAEHCHAGYSTLLYELGVLRYREGYFGDAERYTDAAIACLRRTLGPDHVVVVDDTALHIPIWREQGRYAVAEQLARRSLEQRSALHERGSPAIGDALHQLAEVLYERGALVEAGQRETDGLVRRETAYGRVHASVAESLYGLGRIWLAAAELPAAEAAYREALDLWQQTLGQDHPAVAEATRGLAEVLVAQGRIAEARPLAERALTLQRQRLRSGHPAIAGTLATLGVIAEFGSPQAAEPVFREALAIRRAELAPDHPYTARVESLLGQCLARQHRSDEARPLLRHAAEVLTAQLGDHHPAAQLARERQAASELAMNAPSREPARLAAAPGQASVDQGAVPCRPDCSAGSCRGCDPKAEHCDSGIVTGRVGVVRWPDPDIGPNRIDATIHKTAACGRVKWPFATTNRVCGTFSTWLEDANGDELAGTRYDSATETVQIYGNMWSGAVSACASVCGHSICSPVDP